MLKQREEEAASRDRAREDSERAQVQADLQKRRADAREHAQGLHERIASLPEPIHLACCHTLSKGGGGFFEKINFPRGNSNFRPICPSGYAITHSATQFPFRKPEFSADFFNYNPVKWEVLCLILLGIEFSWTGLCFCIDHPPITISQLSITPITFSHSALLLITPLWSSLIELLPALF